MMLFRVTILLKGGERCLGALSEADLIGVLELYMSGKVIVLKGFAHDADILAIDGKSILAIRAKGLPGEE